MGKIFRLAIKNLTRQKRRNAILAIAIAFGFLIVTFIDGFTSGLVGNLENVISQVAGGTVLVAGYEKIPASEEGKKAQLINIVRDRNYIKELVLNNDIDYRYFSCFTQNVGQLIFNGQKSLIRVTGRDFSEKEFVDSFKLISGSFEGIQNEPMAMVINEKTSESMNLQVGDEVILVTTTLYGQNTVADFKIAAVTKSNTLVDATQVFVNIDYLNQLIGIPEGGYSTFTIFLKDKKQQDKVAQKIEDLIRADGKNVSSRKDAFKTNPKNIGRGIDKQFTSDDYMWEGTKYGVESLNDEIPAIKTVMDIVHMVSTIILLVILLIVMVGVSNTYRMVLYERIREIGTMRSLGMTGKDTGRVFTSEAVILCLIGACAGFIASLLVMLVIHLIPVTNESLSFFLNKGHFSFAISAFTVLGQYLLLIILTTIAVRGTAKKAASLSPAAALRSIK
ncbi:MAG: ABC transporter permease [Treponema sp.]|nr:ABC transporter permease [Treponema sp.]